MNNNHLRHIVTATACVAALSWTPAVATADIYRDIVDASSQNSDSSQSSINTGTGALALMGSSQIPMPEFNVELSDEYPKTIDESITTTEIVDKQVTAGSRWERWTIASPAMKRNVSVQIYRSADTDAPAPMVYMLDGINAEYESGWHVQRRDIDRVFGAENVTLVMPTEARGSLYADWQKPDPELGVNKWETFIVDELAPLLEAEEELNFNGKRGIGGLSMGANAAVHLANDNPDVFDGVFGLSGCYSPTSPIGSQMVSLIVTSRGASTDNLWGPFKSEDWISHDTVLSPKGLRNQAVYLSTGNGALTREERALYDKQESPFSMSNGVMLEAGVLSCTKDLDASMRSEGMTHHRVDYSDHGAHNWITFLEHLQPAWDHVKPALY
ncbi:alpha/beta hydrolase family protein [Corynebacterium breve]|uniref:Alpha/beta hydrolase family protein n=1 Tax=Corynebacterium breve TaxID=3049799 RepID=A0ABY8VG82_9CORY|nr:alpha/beta hydrolase family protein [Corynebacterium breve]WIM68322.1 alpha/beta hydrolase family protein [Corynebacterium breve]